MYVILGRSQDPMACQVARELENRGKTVEVRRTPFSFRLPLVPEIAGHSVSKGFDNSRLKGVFVCTHARDVQADNGSGEVKFFSEETAAALLAWINRLECTVVNRYSALLWYVPRLPLIFWSRLLEKADLVPRDSIITNQAEEIRRFARRHSGKALYVPLNAGNKYGLDRDDWADIEKLRQIAPIHLFPAGAVVLRICVVGSNIFLQQQKILPEVITSRLLAFATFAKLSFLELEIDLQEDGVRVSSVNAFPRLSGFDSETQQKIVAAMVDLLTAH
jgi:hypothetical protein